MSPKESYRVELRSAARQLSDRCLYSAAKWAAELLVDIEPDAPSSSSASASASSRATPSTSGAARSLSHLHPDASAYRRRLRSATASSGDIDATPPAGVSYISTPVPDDDGLDGGGANDRYLLAKSYFDCREYRRAAHALRGQTTKKAVFLRCYALYLVILVPSPLY